MFLWSNPNEATAWSTRSDFLDRAILDKFLDDSVHRASTEYVVHPRGKLLHREFSSLTTHPPLSSQGEGDIVHDFHAFIPPILGGNNSRLSVNNYQPFLFFFVENKRDEHQKSPRARPRGVNLIGKPQGLSDSHQCSPLCLRHYYFSRYALFRQ